ncbi:VPA1267 family protein [Endozoicomonas sp.]|uniref:VPA1267 family protein n=1 Tax=Endozoicomonas sp. TaxID=1892382 RepID=UPI002884332F|nr:VPA1267 family protein [Endozoicomonas sp.]
MAQADTISQAQESLNKFEAWALTQSRSDFVAISRGSRLIRAEVAKGVGVTRSTLNDNVLVKAALLELESNLRDQGVLAPLVNKDEASESEAGEVLHDQSANDLKRLKAENERQQKISLLGIYNLILLLLVLVKD